MGLTSKRGESVLSTLPFRQEMLIVAAPLVLLGRKTALCMRQLKTERVNDVANSGGAGG